MSSLIVPKHALSKTTYMYGVQCTRRLWLAKYLRVKRDVSDEAQTNILQHGTDVGLLAQQLFPGGIDASPENPWSYQQSVINTRRFINSGCDVIYEAAFQFEGILCAIDILVKKNLKWYAFEVKATNSVKPAHISDASLQYYVITNSGLELENISLIYLNKDYIRKEALMIHELFTSVSILNEVLENQPLINVKSKELLEVLLLKSPPMIEMSGHCNIPYPCDFQGFCSQGISNKEEDIVKMAIDKTILSQFENRLEYPLFFVDFNSWMSAIPLYKGHWPYRSNPFYFSIHQQNSPGSPTEHYQYLADGTDSNPALFYQKLIETLGEKGSILMYNNSFHFLKYDALKCRDFDLVNKIEALQSRVSDLNDVFRNGDNLYNYSLNYLFHLLEVPTNKDPKQNVQVDNSRNAAAAFFNLKDERDIMKISEIRSALLEFGESTTSELVKLWNRLEEKF